MSPTHSALRQSAAEDSVLAFAGMVRLGSALAHDPGSFFQTGRRLLVASQLQSWIILQGSIAKNKGATILGIYDVICDIWGREIVSSLPGNRVFEGLELLTRLEQLLTKQLYGGPGDLLSDGHSMNVFPVVEGFVHVFWSSTYYGWNLSLGSPVEMYRQGSRVFSP
jgi:hypothetical protein